MFDDILCSSYYFFSNDCVLINIRVVLMEDKIMVLFNNFLYLLFGVVESLENIFSVRFGYC